MSSPSGTSTSHCCSRFIQKGKWWNIKGRLQYFSHTSTAHIRVVLTDAENVKTKSLCDRFTDQLVRKAVKSNMAPQMKAPLLFVLKDSKKTSREKTSTLWHMSPRTSRVAAAFTLMRGNSKDPLHIVRTQTPIGQH